MTKVAFVTHQTALASPGGAETQLMATLAHVNRDGPDVKAKLFDMWHDRIESFDLVHIFNPGIFPSEALRIAQSAHTKSVRVVVSPISYASFDLVKVEQKRFGALLWTTQERLRAVSSKLRPLQLLDPYRFLDPLLSMSDAILPNTIEEMDRLQRLFPKLSRKKFQVIPNGVDLRFKDGDPLEFSNVHGVRNFVLFVGRIEPRKNVLKLVRAFVLTSLDTQLVIMGETNDEGYLRQCLEEADDRVLVIPPLPHDSKMLASAYKCSKVVALPSFYETPGLAALEGGVAGANVVVTSIGGAREYFGDLAWYVKPEDERSIREALIKAHAAPKSTALCEHLEKHFNWTYVAEKTIKVYESVTKN